MEKKIKEYIQSEVSKLNEDNKGIKLEGVYPSVLENALGVNFDTSEMDTNGWQADYWISTDKYVISGSMYFGTATITLR